MHQETHLHSIILTSREISPPTNGLFTLVQQSLLALVSVYPAAVTRHCEPSCVLTDHTRGVETVGRVRSTSQQWLSWLSLTVNSLYQCLTFAGVSDTEAVGGSLSSTHKNNFWSTQMLIKTLYMCTVLCICVLHVSSKTSHEVSSKIFSMDVSVEQRQKKHEEMSDTCHFTGRARRVFARQ